MHFSNIEEKKSFEHIDLILCTVKSYEEFYNKQLYISK